MKTPLILASLAAMTIPTAAMADPPHRHRAPQHHHRHHHRYDSHGRYAEPVAISRRDHVWRGRDGHYYCRRDNGTTGLVIGAGLGALVGNQLDGGSNRALGTILGAVGGGLLGQKIDRGDLKCR
jgi:hypothetical protein